MEIVKYPLWRVAVERVTEMFESDGYGLIIPHEKLKQWMGIVEPKRVDEVQRAQLDYLSGMERLRAELLESANLYMHPVQGEGYEVLHPKDQISKGAGYYLGKSQRALRKAARVLANVDTLELDTEAKEMHIARINRLAFLKSAFRRRVIE